MRKQDTQMYIMYMISGSLRPVLSEPHMGVGMNRDQPHVAIDCKEEIYDSTMQRGEKEKHG